jgi:hypothetical protein
MRFMNVRAAISLIAISLSGFMTAMPSFAASACGGKDQRACCVTERVPSCNSGLEEKSGCSGDCACGVFKSAGTCRAKPAPPPPPPPVTACGAAGQRACCVTERVPSCDGGLEEKGPCTGDCRCKGVGSSLGMCQAKVVATACGGEGQRACCVAERVPSCNTGLVEQGKCEGNCICGAGVGSSIGKCVKVSCGALNQKPCTLDVQVTQKRRSCDQGLAEDFVNNKCVSADLKAEICKSLLTSLNAGKLPEAMGAMGGDLKNKTSARKGGTNNQALIAQIQSTMKPYEAHIVEAKRLFDVMEKNKVQVMGLFAPETFCNPGALRAKLDSLNLQPSFPKSGGNFFMSYNADVAAGAGVGFQVGYSAVTDYKGNTGGYVTFGPQIVTNVTGGGAVGVQFFPSVTLASFEGWGFGVGVSGGPFKIVSGGADVAFDEQFKFQGFGISAGVGLGLSPVDASIAATHSWKVN